MIRVLENENLQERNSFGTPARSRFWISYDDPKELIDLLNQQVFRSLPKFFIGSGTNLLFVQNFPGILIHSENQDIRIHKETDSEIQIEAGSGTTWDKLVEWTVDRDYYGLENLSLIPGSVGAAAVQNIGAYGVEVGDRILEVQVIDINTGEIFLLSREDCQFAYRNSIFKNQANQSWLITRVRLSLSKIPLFDLSYGSLSGLVQKSGDITLHNVRQTIIETRRSKLPDPKILGNAGSFFKNPLVTLEHFRHLQDKYPQLPHYSSTSSGLVKIPAAWMIEKAGWKGYRNRSAGVYEKQALVLVNHGKATGGDILKLAIEIQESVYRLFEINLEPEVTIIGAE